MLQWKPIPGYEDLYEVSNDGNVRSINPRYKNKSILKQSIGSKGYKIVTLCRKGQQKTINVHRIVAEVFLPNPHNLPCVNHKNENKEDNRVSNLEWCSYYYNNTYGQRLTKSALKIGKPVICIETNKTYPSAYAAEKETNISQSKICLCCHQKRKSAGGFHWSFLYQKNCGISLELSHES